MSVSIGPATTRQRAVSIVIYDKDDALAYAEVLDSQRGDAGFQQDAKAIRDAVDRVWPEDGSDG